MWAPPRVELDIFYFVVCPIVVIAMLFLLLRGRPHWTVELGLSWFVALIAGTAWVAGTGGPFGVWAIVFFFLIPFSGIFLASRVGIVKRRPWSLFIVAPVFYLIAMFLAAGVWTSLLVHPL